MSELIIRGGTVVDGTGSPGILADVAIDGGRITAIGHDLTGDRILDATGCVVAPGFIDIHTHYDAQVFWDGALTPSSWHGVTTVVMGNCGFGVAPTRERDRTTVMRVLENVEGMPYDALEEGIDWSFETFPEYLDAVDRQPLGLDQLAAAARLGLALGGQVDVDPAGEAVLEVPLALAVAEEDELVGHWRSKSGLLGGL